jgi:hypothetical protein
MLKIVAAVLVSALLTACVISIEPTIPPSESVFEPGLLGTWVEAGQKDTAVVTRDGEGGYLIDYTDQDGTGRFTGRLGRLSDHLLLEVRPVLAETGASDAYEALLLPGHLLFVVTLADPEMHLAPLDIDAVREALSRDELRTPHLSYSENSIEGREQVILTGTSAELRIWLRQVLDHPDVLGETGIWRRVAPE